MIGSLFWEPVNHYCAISMCMWHENKISLPGVPSAATNVQGQRSRPVRVFRSNIVSFMLWLCSGMLML